MARQSDHIYVVQSKCACGRAYSKVGISANADVRLGHLQGGNPIRLALVYIARVKEASKFEAAVHSAFKSRAIPNMNCEWFELSATVAKRAIAGIARKTGVELKRIDVSDFENFPTPEQCRKTREALDLTISDFADLAHVCRATVSNYENGHSAWPQKLSRRGILAAFSKFNRTF